MPLRADGLRMCGPLVHKRIGHPSRINKYRFCWSNKTFMKPTLSRASELGNEFSVAVVAKGCD